MYSLCSPNPPLAAAQPPFRRETTALQRIVEENYDRFVEERRQQGRPVSRSVRREFTRFLQCGDPHFGYAAIDCGNCGELQSVPLSCKRRAWCPRCLVRRMLDRGSFMSERILGDVPVRHFVLTFPPPLRYALAYNHELLGRLVSIAAKAVLSFQRRKARRALSLKSVNDAHPGAISSVHRSSSNLDSNVHIHMIVTEGVFVREQAEGGVVFRELPPPTEEEISEIAWDICRRTTVALKRAGMWRDLDDESVNADEFPPTPARQMRGVFSTGPTSEGREVTYFARAVGRVHDDHAGYSFDLYARRGIAKGDAQGRLKLARYMLHPPLTDRQISRSADGRVLFTQDRPWQTPTKAVVLDPLDLLTKLALLVPPARSKTVRFHGVYAPNATLRDEVLSYVAALQSIPQTGETQGHCRPIPVAEVLRRHTGVDLTRCPHCFGPTRVTVRFPYRSARKRIRSVTGLPGDSPDQPSPHTPGVRTWLH